MDDWFAEPKPEPTLNELYDRRLVAWGWLSSDRETPSWELTTAAKVYESLTMYYLPSIQKRLNEELSLVLTEKGLRASDWRRHPEGPA